MGFFHALTGAVGGVFDPAGVVTGVPLGSGPDGKGGIGSKLDIGGLGSNGGLLHNGAAANAVSDIPGKIDDQVAKANAIAQQYQTAYGNFAPTAAPTMNAAQIGGTAQATAPGQYAVTQAADPTLARAGQAFSTDAQAAQLNQAQLAQFAPRVDAQDVQAQDIERQRAIQAQQVQAAQVGASPQAQATLAAQTQLGPTTNAQAAQLGPTALANASQIAQDPQAQFRAGQQGLVSGLQGAISGQDPSVAAIMLRQATERNSANQFALSQAGGGQNAGLAQRQAMINAGDINQQAAGQQALLRAQEIATARGQLGGALDSARGADIGLATGQASLQQGANLANAGALNQTNIAQGQLTQGASLANAGAANNANLVQGQLTNATALANANAQTGTSQFNSGQDAARQLAQAQLTQGASLANQSANLQAATTNTTVAQQAALAEASNRLSAAQGNQSANLAANTTNASLAQGVNLANQGAVNQQNIAQGQLTQGANLQNANNATNVSQSNAGNVTSTANANAQLQNATNLANANANNQAASQTQQIQSQTNLSNVGAINATNATNAQFQQGANTSNQSANLQQQGINNSAQQNLAGNALNSSGQAMQGLGAEATAAAAAAKQEQDAKSAKTGIIGSVIGAISDRRAKKNIKKTSEAELAEFMGALSPSSWRYKNPGLPGAALGKRFGVMAQDLEKSKIGKALVRDRPDGLKEIDVGQATGTILAAISSMNKRLSAAEKR